MINFTNATGNLFNRLGKLGLLIKQMSTYQAAQLTNMISTSTGVVAQYNSEPDIQAIMGSSYIGNLSGPESVGSTAQQMTVATFNRTVYRDSPLLNQTLQSNNITGSIQEVIRQMKQQGATVLAMTVTGTPSGFTGVGTGVVVVSVRRPSDGKILENSFAEIASITCTTDSYSGGATRNNEGFTINGDGAENDVFAFDWPLGSNANVTLSAIDGDTSNGSGNTLSNSGFTTWTSNVPNSWNLVVGTAGVNIFQETSIVYTYTGQGAIRLIGDAGGTLTALTQGISLQQANQYACNLFLRTGATAPAAGVLTIDLIDEDNNIVNDNNGIANSFTIDLTGLNTVYTAYNGVFRTPTIMPDSLFIRMRLSTPLTNGALCYIDKMSLGLMTQMYTGGPYVSVHAGNVPFENGDYAAITITNSRGSGGTLNTFQTLLFRLLYPYVLTNEYIFPSSSSPSISDNLIS